MKPSDYHAALAEIERLQTQYDAAYGIIRGLEEEIARKDAALDAAESFQYNYEHATKLERAESAQECDRLREALKQIVNEWNDQELRGIAKQALAGEKEGVKGE